MRGFGEEVVDLRASVGDFQSADADALLLEELGLSLLDLGVVACRLMKILCKSIAASPVGNS